MQKWEIRYPLLLWNLVMTVMSQRSQIFPAVQFDDNTNCNSACSSRCSTNNIKQITVSSKPECQKCTCFDGSVTFLDDFKSRHPENVPFLFSTPAVPVLGENAEFSCIRWRRDQPGELYGRNYLRREDDHSLPNQQQQRWYVARGAGFSLIITNVTFIVDASTASDSLQCWNDDPEKRPVIRGLMSDAFPLFAFRLTTPEVTGPIIVRPQQRATWTCTVDFVTILTDTGEDVDFALEIVNAGYLHVTLLGPMLTDVTQEEVRGKQMVKTLTMVIPSRLINSVFDLRCTAIHRVVGVTVHSSLLRVKVPESSVVKDIGTKLTSGGAALGCLGVLIGFGFCTHYFLSKRKHLPAELEQPELPFPPVAPAAPKPGILKGAKPETAGGNLAAQPASLPLPLGVPPTLEESEVDAWSPAGATPTATPTVAPTDTPAATPTATPTAAPTATPAATPTATPTASPTATPSATSAASTTAPTATSTTAPTATPAAAPTVAPTDTPSVAPTGTPSATPVATPTATK